MKNFKETRGRKRVEEKDKVMRNDLTKIQWVKLGELAEQYGVPVAVVHRTAVQWYLDALAKNNRQGSITTEKEDAEFEELTISGN